MNHDQKYKLSKILGYIVILLFLGTVAFCMVATTTKRNDNITAKTSAPSIQNYGDYYLFETTKSQEYLEFIATFNNDEYEIIDISTSLNVYFRGSDEFYMVTYRKIL